MFRHVWLIFKKEMLTSLRNRRTLIYSLLFPLVLWPAFSVLPMLIIGNKERKAKLEPSKVLLVGDIEVQELNERFERSPDVRLVRADDASSAVRDGVADCVVYLDSISADSLRLYARILFDATRTTSRAAADKVELLFSAYEKEVVNDRLARKGIPTEILTAVSSERVNTVSETQMVGFFLGLFIGMFVVMGAMIGGMAPVIDSTAGEKERRSLELLLTVPASRFSIMFGKYLAGVVYAFISPLLTMLGIGVAVSLVAPTVLAGGAGINVMALISVDKLMLVLLVVLLLAMFIVGMQMAIAVSASSYRQAQTYLTPLNIIVVIPVIFMQALPAVLPDWMFWVPFMNVMLFLRGLLMNTLPSQAAIYTIASNLVFLVLALRFAAKAFGSEKVLLR